MSNFKSVLNFMKTAEQSIKPSVYTEVFNKDEKLIKFRLDLIDEEVKELHQAVKDKNMLEVIDALGDILYVVYGAGGSLGIDLDAAFDVIHKSNMSKFCKTKEEAKDTVNSYVEKFVKGESPYDSPSYKLVNGLYVVYNKSTGKVLKNINYIPAKEGLLKLMK